LGLIHLVRVEVSEEYPRGQSIDGLIILPATPITTAPLTACTLAASMQAPPGG
jgi:hypothetical protein